MMLAARTIPVLLTLLLMASMVQSGPLEGSVIRWVRDTYALDTSCYEIEVLSDPWQPSEADQGEWSFRALTQTRPTGLFTVLAERSEEGAQTPRRQIRLRIREFAEVLVALDRLKRQEPADPNKLVLRRMEITSLQEQPIRSLDELEGFRMKRNLGKGKILTTGLIEPVPDIEVGREVSIVFANDLCTVTVPGRMLETGWVGECVKVKNIRSGKIITARVFDSLSVVVGP